MPTTVVTTIRVVQKALKTVSKLVTPTPPTSAFFAFHQPNSCMNFSIKYYAPQSGGGNSHINQKEKGKAGKDGAKQRSTKKTTEKVDPDKVENTKKNANSVD